ncbi:MAG: helix-turn-helix transcriptional regulator [Candidatus Gastranaerophilales bacterium]|nr:helix-turn-helix transcriptional regulator [Candidatus Gastranaerophilales bacterium]
MNKNTKERFGQKIRILRTQKNFSREYLAEKTNLSTYYIGQIERGEHNITFNVLIDLANAFDIEIKELFEFSF